MMFHKRNRICCIAAAALLLTACADAGSSAAESKPETTPAAQSAETTTGGIETTTDALAETTTDAAGTTTTAAVTTGDSRTTAASTTTAAQQTAPEISDEPVAFSNYFRIEQVLPIRCKGTVTAPDGLNMRAEPSTSGKKIKLIKDGTELEVEGIVLTGSIYSYEDRWLKVKSGSDEGYMLAEYVNCVCTEKPETLSMENRVALGSILYYQGMRLVNDFHREGGVPNLNRTGRTNEEGFEKLTPKKTIAKLREEYHIYFAKAFPDDFDYCYHQETDGYLWTATGYGDNVLLDYVELNRLDKSEDSALTYNVTVHWRKDDDFFDYPEYEEMVFRLVYEDGSWKIAEMKSLY